MKLAVTGATGFIGVHLIHHLLQEGHELIAIKRSCSDLSQFRLISSTYSTGVDALRRLKWEDCDLYDVEGMAEILTDCDYLIHAAAMISYDRRDRVKLIQVNAGLTGTLVDVCLDTGTAMLLLSSTAAISKNPYVQMLNEEQNWDRSYAYSNYGLSKHLAELEFWRGIEEGMKGFIVNPGIVLGFGDWNKSSLQIFKKACNSFPFYSLGTTAFTGVTDLCEVIIQLLQKEANAERYLLINENRTFKDILYLMAAEFGVKPPGYAVNGFVLSCLRGLVRIKEILHIKGLISAETVRSATSQFRFSNEKVTKFTGHRFRSMEEVIRDAVVQYRKSSH